ncbi:hypothetical protein BJ965_000318 [Streptomyces luteogriseus]|uniref:Uncharacterized protein n=1 Tax=Streptomyces luteogriseus TaxID=68233 RepID=A0A7W7DGN7_9ACTN|nr:hypothetical protein [Streptomyces luteogriseus]
MRIPGTRAFLHDPADALVTDGRPVAALPGCRPDDAGAPR